MKIINNKINEMIVCVVISICAAIFLPIAIKNAAMCVLGLIFAVFFGVKLYQLLKIKKNNAFFTVKAICTNKSFALGNISSTKNYEFEPTSKDEYPDVITLNLANDDAKGASAIFKRERVKVGNSYNLIFKTNNDGSKTANSQNYIGLERIILS